MYMYIVIYNLLSVCQIPLTKYNLFLYSVDFPRDRVPVVLAPLLYKDEQDITEER